MVIKSTHTREGLLAAVARINLPYIQASLTEKRYHTATVPANPTGNALEPVSPLSASPNPEEAQRPGSPTGQQAQPGPDSLKTLLQASPFPEVVMDQFFTDEALTGATNLFLGLASALAPAFPPLTTHQQQLLDAATYLIAIGVYQLDPVLDQQVEGQSRVERAFHGQLFLLEAQRLLSQLFSPQDPFWSLYYQRIQQHYQEVSLSKDIRPLTELTYQQLLAHKYAMLYFPIDALFFLTGQTHQHPYQLLQKSLGWFSQGYNLPNEVMGLSEDVALCINNYAYWRLKPVLAAAGIDTLTLQADTAQALVYVSGLGVTLMDEAIAAFTKAAGVVAPLGLSAYEALIQRRIANVKERQIVLVDVLAA